MRKSLHTSIPSLSFDAFLFRSLRSLLSLSSLLSASVHSHRNRPSLVFPIAYMWCFFGPLFSLFESVAFVVPSFPHSLTGLAGDAATLVDRFEWHLRCVRRMSPRRCVDASHVLFTAVAAGTSSKSGHPPPGMRLRASASGCYTATLVGPLFSPLAVAGLSCPDRGHHVPALVVTSGGRGVGVDVACLGTPGGFRTSYAGNST